MAKFWPLHHYNQCMGENRRKTLSTAHGRGCVYLIFSPNTGNWLGGELNYGSCPISLCAL